MLPVGLWCWGIYLGWPSNSSGWEESCYSISWGKEWKSVTNISPALRIYLSQSWPSHYLPFISRNFLLVKIGQMQHELLVLSKVMSPILSSLTLTPGHQARPLLVTKKDEEKSLVKNHFETQKWKPLDINITRLVSPDLLLALQHFSSFTEATRCWAQRHCKKCPSGWGYSTSAWRWWKVRGLFIYLIYYLFILHIWLWIYPFWIIIIFHYVYVLGLVRWW